MKNLSSIVISLVVFCSLPLAASARDIEHVIRCESDGFAPYQCPYPIGPQDSEIKVVRMVKQYSSKPCIEGKSWGAQEDGIVVTNGCRADFLVVYRLSDRSSRYERYHDERGRRDRGRYNENYRAPAAEDPTDIVFRAFEDILNRRPSREELRSYRHLIIDRNWTEHDVRADLRRSYSRHHY